MLLGHSSTTSPRRLLGNAGVAETEKKKRKKKKNEEIFQTVPDLHFLNHTHTHTHTHTNTHSHANTPTHACMHTQTDKIILSLLFMKLLTEQMQNRAVSVQCSKSPWLILSVSNNPSLIFHCPLLPIFFPCSLMLMSRIDTGIFAINDQLMSINFRETR